MMYQTRVQKNESFNPYTPKNAVGLGVAGSFQYKTVFLYKMDIPVESELLHSAHSSS